MRTELRQERDHDEVVGWRCSQLVHSGFPLWLASRIAGEARLDLHALIELAERGCPPELAVRILSPIEGEQAA